ncbi:MAG: hemolysin III family protein, partial [Flavobacteriia bacterium]|nr:hemolysin III family protein [Flavobacteriia bacterium]
MEESDPWKITGFSIYGVSLILLYLASTLYHTFTGKLKGFFKKVDHLAIYLLIAGSYSPFLLGPLRDTVGWTVFLIVWTLVLIGFIVE